MRAHTYGSITEDCRPTSYSRFDCHGEQSSCKKQCPLFGTYIVVVSPLFFFCSRILTFAHEFLGLSPQNQPLSLETRSGDKPNLPAITPHLPATNPPRGVTNPPRGVTNPPRGVTNPPRGVTNPHRSIVTSAHDFVTCFFGFVATISCAIRYFLEKRHRSKACHWKTAWRKCVTLIFSFSVLRDPTLLYIAYPCPPPTPSSTSWRSSSEQTSSVSSRSAHYPIPWLALN